MWVLEIERVNGKVQEFTFDTYVKLDKFLHDFMSWKGLIDKISDRIWATEDSNRPGASVGDMLEEYGELFHDDGHDTFYGNYWASRVK